MRRILIISAIICCLLPSCISVIAHDEKAAAKAATQFAQTAFVDRDFSKAHGGMSPAAAQQISAERLSEVVAKMHPDSLPTQVTATDFEPMPGQRGMVIYLKGSNNGEDFYYRFTMEGDESTGYRVSGLLRDSGPYPSTNKRPL